MNKRGSKFYWISVILLIILVVIIFFYFVLFNPHNKFYSEEVKSGRLINPASNLSIEQGVKEFDESYVFYLLYSIGAYNLHNPPLSYDKPRIEIDTEDKIYNAVIEGGKINVFLGEIDDEDIRIKTTKEELVLVLKNKDYFKESFSSGKSSMDLVADKTKLFSKGYLNLYKELTGKSVTGSVIRIYTS